MSSSSTFTGPRCGGGQPTGKPGGGQPTERSAEVTDKYRRLDNGRRFRVNAKPEEKTDYEEADQEAEDKVTPMSQASFLPELLSASGMPEWAVQAARATGKTPEEVMQSLGLLPPEPAAAPAAELKDGAPSHRAKKRRLKCPPGFGKVFCEKCGSEGAGFMGLPETEYTGTFFCTRCWDALPSYTLKDGRVVKGRSSGFNPRTRYDYKVLLPESGHLNARLVERNEDLTWTIQYRSKEMQHDVPEHMLACYAQPNKEPVASIEKVKDNIRIILADKEAHEDRSLSVTCLDSIFRKRFDCRIVYPKLGHPNLASLLEDPAFKSEFVKRGSLICEAASLERSKPLDWMGIPECSRILGTGVPQGALMHQG